MGYFQISDPFSFRDTYMSVAQLFRDPPWHLKGPIDIVAELRKITANKLKMSNGLCIDQVKLTKGSVTGFKNFFIKQSNSEKIPWVYGPLSAMPVIGNAITAVTSTIDGLQRITAGPINSDQLAILMADVGRL